MLATWGASSGFNVASLFAAGEQGAWYDPSDNTTMFTTSAGTTQVTAVETAVGLILDKSKGLALGSEVVTNGNFDTNTTGWTDDLLTSSVSSGVVTVANTTANFGSFYQQTTVVANTWYFVSFRVKAGTSNITCRVERTLYGSEYGTRAVSNTSDFTTVSFYVLPTNTVLIIRCNLNNVSGANSFIDSISVKPVAGNHAYQSTDASRPILRSRYNLLTYSEQFDNGAWSKVNITVSANTSGTTDPLGGNTADKLEETNAANSLHQSAQSGVSLSAITATASVYIKAAERSNCTVLLQNGVASDFAFSAFTLTGSGTAGAIQYFGSGFSAGVAAITAVGNGWYRCSVTATRASAFTPQIVVEINDGATRQYTGITGWGIYVWGAQITQPAVFPSNTYQRIAASTDYATGAAFPQYLSFDGTDDSLLTASVDFTGTDKMTVWGGVSKLSDAAGGSVVAELSADINTNNGSFTLVQYSNATGWAFGSKGTIRQNAEPAGQFLGIRTDVLTGLSQINTPSVLLRVNGTQAVVNTTSQGTSNFGNYPLYIGRRGGATLPFNGRIYSLIVRGAASNATQIAQTERYVASKTPLGVVP